MQIARRFTANKVSLSAALLAALTLAPSLVLAQMSSSTLDQVSANGELKLGYYPAAKPLSYTNGAGAADGFTVALCRGIAAVVKHDLNRSDLSVRFVPVEADPVAAVRDGQVDLLCGPLQPTLSRRAQVSFSIPVFIGGTGVLMRKDGSTELRDLLEGRSSAGKTVWRGQPQLAVLNQRRFVVVAGTSSETWAKARKTELGVNSIIDPVPDLQTGVQRVLDGEADGFLGDRSVLLEAARSDESGELMVLDRVVDRTLVSLTMRRGDEDFRLLVDRTISRLYRSGLIDGIYEKHLGKPSVAVRQWFKLVAEPE